MDSFIFLNNMMQFSENKNEQNFIEEINPMPRIFDDIKEFRKLPHRFQKDKTVIKEWNKRTQKVSWYIPSVLRSDYDFMLDMVKDNKYTMYFIANELKKNQIGRAHV